MRVITSVWIEPDTVIDVQPSYVHQHEDGHETRVPWVVGFDRTNLNLHVEDREVLTKLRDAITAALDANPDAS